MGVILVNAKFDTKRPLYSSSTGTTGKPVSFLSRVRGHYQPMYARHVQIVPSSAVKSTHLMIVDPKTDIQKGDQVINITLTDNVTPWPGDIGPVNYAWDVVYVRVSGAGPLSNRICYLERYEVGGPAHP